MTEIERDASEGEVQRLPQGFKRRLLRHMAVEIGPLLVFFGVYFLEGLIWATGAYALATAAAFAIAWTRTRRLPVLPSITFLLVALFAALTLVFGDATFIKIKPTVVNGFYGAVLLVGWLLRYRLVERVLAGHARLDERGLRLLTLRAGAYLVGLAALNEVVWRSVPTEQWVVFKVFVMVGLNLLFAWSQLPLVRRHLRRAEG